MGAAVSLVVVRRRFEPAVPIHVREEWKCSARVPPDVDGTPT